MKGDFAFKVAAIVSAGSKQPNKAAYNRNFPEGRKVFGQF
jgi:hypothetical protein